MPVKRKRTTLAPEEAPNSKRQLRSGQILLPPPPPPPKRAVASRRLPPQKRATDSKPNKAVVPEDVTEENSDDSNVIDSSQDNRCLSDETNTIRVNNVKTVEPVTSKRGRLAKGKGKALGPVEEDTAPQNACIEPDAEYKAPVEPTAITNPSTPTRPRSTRFTPVVEISTPMRNIKQASISRAKARQPSVSERESSSPEDKIATLVQSTSIDSVNVHLTPKKSPVRNVAALTSDTTASSDEEVVNEIILSPTKPPIFSTQLTGFLSDHLMPCFNAYKRSILKSLRCPSLVLPAEPENSVNGIATKQLVDLIDGTVIRAEGNSCLLLGPRGSGKSKIVDACIEKVAPQNPIILRLSGWAQNTDRHALREIAFQLLQQTGSSLLPDSDKIQPEVAPELPEDEEDNPFLDKSNHLTEETTLSLPPSSHLHALIPVLLTLSRPVIVILDAFDLFALHPRQSLLYCLLDTVQNCRASSESRGIIVIGITSRVNAVELLEKRVKSRFSGRTIRTAPAAANLQTFLTMVKTILEPPLVQEGDDDEAEWRNLWTVSVNKFLEDKNVTSTFNETFGITRDFKVLARILTTCVLRLTPTQPYLSYKILSASIESQRSRPRATYLNNLPYPALCLLIASIHADTAGHKAFTFEMIYDSFRDQVRALASAPVQVNGGNIGMMRCTREVLMGAFEGLIASNVFVSAVTPSSNVAKQFVKYRCDVDRHDVKAIIDKAGNTNLKKWLSKNQ